MPRIYTTISESENPYKYKEKAALRRLRVLERVMGIEPTRPAWKAGILPLNYTRVRLPIYDTTFSVVCQGVLQIFFSKNDCVRNAR